MNTETGAYISITQTIFHVLEKQGLAIMALRNIDDTVVFRVPINPILKEGDILFDTDDKPALKVILKTNHTAEQKLLQQCMHSNDRKRIRNHYCKRLKRNEFCFNCRHASNCDRTKWKGVKH